LHFLIKNREAMVKQTPPMARYIIERN